MNEQEFEKLLKLAKSNDWTNKSVAATIAIHSDLPNQDKNKIIDKTLTYEWDVKKSLYPFKKR